MNDNDRFYELIDKLEARQDQTRKTLSNWFISFVIAFVSVFLWLIASAVSLGELKNQVHVNSIQIERKTDAETIEAKFQYIIEKINQRNENHSELQ